MSQRIKCNQLQKQQFHKDLMKRNNEVIEGVSMEDGLAKRSKAIIIVNMGQISIPSFTIELRCHLKELYI